MAASLGSSGSGSARPLVLKAGAWLPMAPPPAVTQTSSAPSPPRPRSPPGCAFRSEVLGLARTAHRAVQDVRGGAGPGAGSRAGLKWAAAWGCGTWESSADPAPSPRLQPQPPLPPRLGRHKASRRPASPTPTHPGAERARRRRRCRCRVSALP